MSSLSPVSRNAVIDCTKGLACALIIWHHLAFYGPMADVVQPLLPGLIEWLYEDARMAVQLFLVLAGYLAAASLAPDGLARHSQPWVQIVRRFVRLVVPLAVALVLAVLVTALVRPWFDHASLSAAPTLFQLLAHALLLQGIVGEESLSAGVWYVSIDFQLFALTALLFAVVRWFDAAPGTAPRARPTPGQIAVVLLAAASLWGFNRDADFDNWAVYFFGAYGLGMMAFWAVRSPRPWAWSALMAALLGVALWLEWRTRIALAGAAALALIAAMRSPQLQRLQGPVRLQQLGRMSYSVFLVHFPVCLLVNAVVTWFWPESLAINLFGLCAAFALSLAVGRFLYLRVERHMPGWQDVVRWQASLVGTGMLMTWVTAWV
ncbi:acyltransferase family protein [Comamonas endophytica]|uniref:Acyltransferase family protein n=1 Tax=Comamonas endophytica TaxID=2949090 RepID=A0ABY6G8H8_9BURK|nr:MULTISPECIES: acyltransferase family protein [unclassified Acidovorax]MCD2514479.1 acyltransferase family protein [Acidovorax sp. D4N7]UYG51060.1 acyltransferase family protein [Acidovorax sp. 5MLIR]